MSDIVYHLIGENRRAALEHVADVLSHLEESKKEHDLAGYSIDELIAAVETYELLQAKQLGEDVARTEANQRHIAGLNAINERWSTVERAQFEMRTIAQDILMGVREALDPRLRETSRQITLETKDEADVPF